LICNWNGIALETSDNNTIQGNEIRVDEIVNELIGISLSNSGFNLLINNIISYHQKCNILIFENSEENLIIRNTLHNSSIGIVFLANNNTIYHNNFIENIDHTLNSSEYGFFNNTWDNGYPSGGNYWDTHDEDAEEVYDYLHGEDQDVPGPDGIADQPYPIPGSSDLDFYPLMHPDGWKKLIVEDFGIIGHDTIEL
jgi:parallel beta-helix repeat protein